MNKISKRFFSSLLCLLLLASLFPAAALAEGIDAASASDTESPAAPASAEESVSEDAPASEDAAACQDDADCLIELPAPSSGFYVNPSYLASPEAGTESAESAVYAPDRTFTDMEQLAAEIKTQIKSRYPKGSYDCDISGGDWLDFDVLSDLLFAHSGNPIEGDYLKLHLASYGWETSPEYVGDALIVHLTFTANLFTTAQQENAVSAAVSSVLSSLSLEGKSDFEKVKAIYNYLASTVRYDYEHVNTDYPLMHSSYAALIDHTAVCQGYAATLYRLLLTVGVDCRVISNSGHAWNIVRLDGQYYNLDVTWDEGCAEEDWIWFLKCNAHFKNHTRNAEYETDAFNAAYPMATEDYIKREGPTVVPVNTPWELKTADGGTINQDSFPGKTILLVFSKDGCGNCEYLLNDLDGSDWIKDPGLQVIVANISGSDADAVKSVKNALPHQGDGMIFTEDSDGSGNNLLWTYLWEQGLYSISTPVCMVLKDNTLVDYWTGFCTSEECQEYLSEYLQGSTPVRTPGDVNGDGVINGKDVTRLCRFLAGYSVEITAANADVNSDGKVNGKDLTRLCRALAGYDVVLQ